MHLHEKSARRQPLPATLRPHRGQAVGSEIGGVLFARDMLYGAGYVAVAFLALALISVTLTKPRRAAASAT
jgi:hypothetical protein